MSFKSFWFTTDTSKDLYYRQNNFYEFPAIDISNAIFQFVPESTMLTSILWNMKVKVKCAIFWVSHDILCDCLIQQFESGKKWHHQ